MENKFNDSLFEFKIIITKNGKAIDAIIDASDTYLNTKKTKRKQQKEKNAA